MARPESAVPKSLDEALAELRRDPSQPVQAVVDDLEIELRVVRHQADEGVGTRLAAIGPWEGITLEELTKLLREARQTSGSATPPDLP
jgi:hypothetical protein